MKRIAVIGTRGFPNIQGGIEKHCESLYPRLASMGYEIVVFSRIPYEQLSIRDHSFKGVRIVPLACPRNRSMETIIHSFYSLIKMKRYRPELIHIHAIGPALITPLARILHKPILLTHHGPDYERSKWGKIARFMLRLGEHAGLRFSDAVIAISESLANELKQRSRAPVFYMPNGIDVPDLIQPGELHLKFGLQPRKYIFLACRFVPEKGLLDLIKAYERLAWSEIKLVLAGGADHDTVFSRELIRKSKEIPGLILTGPIYGKHLAELYSNAGLFVLPSHYEGLPIALLEAMSYRLPILASDIPPNLSLQLSSERYYNCGDIDDLSGKLRSSIMTGITEEEREKNVEVVRKLYDWDSIALKVAELYERLIV